ncbi:MAG TPA: hydantoinase/oxoprolinase family protein [Pirellulales bacterium]
MARSTALLAIDVGGANLKVADGQGFALSNGFALWKTPERLPAALAELIRNAPPANGRPHTDSHAHADSAALVATMTGELADCFATKAAGVRAIVAALVEAAAGRSLRIYLTDGALVSPEEAIERPLAAAASNWRAVAQFAARYVSQRAGLLIDIGGTTTDIIPIIEGRPSALGLTDPARLSHGELVYTGVVRSPICAVVESLLWRGTKCPTAQELFATTLDAYLTLGELPEDAGDLATADGRPATRAAAHDRLARAICADRTMFDEGDALIAAEAIRAAQSARLATAIVHVLARMAVRPTTIVLSGQGEFLARRVLKKLPIDAEVISLAAQLGPDVSRCAPAHALAVLTLEAAER